MRRRLFRRVAATGALVGGFSGIVANLALLGFFALSRPLVSAASPWALLGPVNDVIGAVSTAALIPMVGYLVLFGIAGVAGLPAYLAFPVWPILLARKVLADPGPGTPSTTTVDDAAPRHPAR